jgi:anti-anti-sigma factor
VGDDYALFPQGDLDIAAVPQLERQVRDVIERYRPGTLVVDLSGVPFLDCAGIGFLVRAQKRMLSAGGRLEVANPGDLARRVLALTGADTLLGVGGRVAPAAVAVERKAVDNICT